MSGALSGPGEARAFPSQRAGNGAYSNRNRQYKKHTHVSLNVSDFLEGDSGQRTDKSMIDTSAFVNFSLPEKEAVVFPRNSIQLTTDTAPSTPKSISYTSLFNSTERTNVGG